MSVWAAIAFCAVLAFADLTSIKSGFPGACDDGKSPISCEGGLAIMLEGSGWNSAPEANTVTFEPTSAADANNKVATAQTPKPSCKAFRIVDGKLVCALIAPKDCVGVWKVTVGGVGGSAEISVVVPPPPTVNGFFGCTAAGCPSGKMVKIGGDYFDPFSPEQMAIEFVPMNNQDTKDQDAVPKCTYFGVPGFKTLECQLECGQETKGQWQMKVTYAGLDAVGPKQVIKCLPPKIEDPCAKHVCPIHAAAPCIKNVCYEYKGEAKCQQEYTRSSCDDNDGQTTGDRCEDGVCVGNVKVPAKIQPFFTKINQCRAALVDGVAEGSFPLAPLRWDPKLALEAEAHASACQKKVYSISDVYSDSYGYLGVTSKRGTFLNAEKTVNQDWCGTGDGQQKDSFTWSKNFNSYTCQKGVCTMYSQVVWNETSHVGCAEAEKCNDDKEDVVVCLYRAMGNWKGQTPYDGGNSKVVGADDNQVMDAAEAEVQAAVGMGQTSTAQSNTLTTIALVVVGAVVVGVVVAAVVVKRRRSAAATWAVDAGVVLAATEEQAVESQTVYEEA